MPELDSLDTRLLALIQRDARRTAQELGERVGLSASAVQKRLRRLRRDGLIDREVAILSPRASPGSLLLVVRIVLVQRTNAIPAFQARMNQASEVMQCYHVTGDSDFVLILSAAGMQDYEAFAQAAFVDSGLVARFETSVVLRPVKIGFELPL